MKRWGFLKIAAILSLLHLLLAAGSFVLGWSIGIRRWDSGPRGPLEATANAMAEVLLQPGIRFLAAGMSGDVELGIIAANSILWGVVGALVVLAIRKAGRIGTTRDPRSDPR